MFMLFVLKARPTSSKGSPTARSPNPSPLKSLAGLTTGCRTPDPTLGCEGVNARVPGLLEPMNARARAAGTAMIRSLPILRRHATTGAALQRTRGRTIVSRAEIDIPLGRPIASDLTGLPPDPRGPGL